MTGFPPRQDEEGGEGESGFLGFFLESDRRGEAKEEGDREELRGELVGEEGSEDFLEEEEEEKNLPLKTMAVRRLRLGLGLGFPCVWGRHLDGAF